MKGASEGCSESDSDVAVQNGAESSLVEEVDKNQNSYLILLEHNIVVHNHRVEVFSQWEMVYFDTKVDCVFLMWAS